jgi:aldose sugar dehydrogenase
MLSRLSAANVRIGPVAAVLIGLGLVGLGMILEKYSLLPARAVDRVINRAQHWFEFRRNDASAFLARQYSYDSGDISLERDIDSGLLPLKVRGLRLSNTQPVPKVGGGIVSIGTALVAVDRLGNFYEVQPAGEVRKLDVPHLPNNLEAYAAANGQIASDYFRVYSAVYLKASHELAVSHEVFDVEHKGTRMGVSLIEFDPATLKTIGAWRTIFKGEFEAVGPNVAGGGRMAADASGNIYLTIGVYQINGTDAAQSDTKLLGKIIKIDSAKGTWTTISKGHRNPQGLVLTTKGEIWSTEHGPAGGDELNRIVAGANYGWPKVTLGTEYGRYSWESGGPVGRHDGIEAPVFAWLPSIGASNLIEIEDFDPRWNGDLLVSSLKAQSLYRLRLDNGHVMYSEPIWIGQRIRDIAKLADGIIALWTDDSLVLFLTVDRERLASDRRWPVALGETIMSSCMYCHHFGPTTSGDPAPSLSNIFGRKIASDNYRYSTALRSKEGNWTEAALKQFLVDPDRFASGTSMPARGLTPEQIDEVVATLKRLEDAAQPSMIIEPTSTAIDRGRAL